MLTRVDDLYERVVTAPATWSDDQLADWVNDTFAADSPPSRAAAREVRRAVRMAQKLRDFWNDPPDGVPSDAGDWRTRVDVAYGIRAWRPLLGLARVGLEEQPDPELFEEAKRRFREVHGAPWMEGVSYEDWLDGSDDGA